jgi:hypothetical protein
MCTFLPAGPPSVEFGGGADPKGEKKNAFGFLPPAPLPLPSLLQRSD